MLDTVLVYILACRPFVQPTTFGQCYSRYPLQMHGCSLRALRIQGVTLDAYLSDIIRTSIYIITVRKIEIEEILNHEIRIHLTNN